MTKQDPEATEFPSEKDLKKTANSAQANLKASQPETKQKAAAQTAQSAGNDNEAVIDKLLDKNQELEKKLRASQDQYLRAEAEIQNIKRHNQMEQADLIKYDGQKLATAILPSLDNLQRALQAQSSNKAQEESILTGVKMVLKHLQQALKENQVEEIPAAGQKFDPTLHQAVQTVPADDQHPAETVVEVLQTGYKLKDRVLRPSMVVVAQ